MVHYLRSFKSQVSPTQWVHPVHPKAASHLLALPTPFPAFSIRIYHLLVPCHMYLHILFIVYLLLLDYKLYQGRDFALFFSAIYPVPQRAPVMWLGVQDMFVEWVCCFLRRGPLQPNMQNERTSVSPHSFWGAEKLVITGSPTGGSIMPACLLLWDRWSLTANYPVKRQLNYDIACEVQQFS